MQHDHRADARAAFMGLIFGAIILFVMVYTIVYLTNKKYEGHRETPAAQH